MRRTWYIYARRQLTEKYQQLTRKYERESKANKRLSMDKEELLWKLSLDPSSDMLRRSLSRSPTGKTASETPSTPALSSSLRPTSAVVLRPKKHASPLMPSEAQQPMNLCRSGTYDLLNEDIDEGAASQHTE